MGAVEDELGEAVGRMVSPATSYHRVFHSCIQQMFTELLLCMWHLSRLYGHKMSKEGEWALLSWQVLFRRGLYSYAYGESHLVGEVQEGFPGEMTLGLRSEG